MRVVAIGSSAAALSAIEHFRKYDQKSTVTVITVDQGMPYSKVLLPYVLGGKIPYSGMTIRENDYFDKLNVTCVHGEVARLLREEKKICLTDGSEYHYDKLLIASGARASVPRIDGVEDDHVCYMRTREDLDHMMPLLVNNPRVIVIGSGFVALQTAWAARYRGLSVTVLGHRIMPTVMDETGSEYVVKAIRDCGVTLLAPVHTNRIERQTDGTFLVNTEEGDAVSGDLILVGVGIKANMEFLEGSGIKAQKGILVNRRMQTIDPDIYAAGDVAAGCSIFGEEHVVRPLWPTAIEMGKVAGCQMAGVDMPYDGSLNMSVTQMFNVTVASIGKFRNQDVDERIPLPEQFGYGYCNVFLKDGILCGTTLVGSSEGVPFLAKLRPLIARREPLPCRVEDLGQYVNKKAFAKAFNGGSTL